MVLQSGMHFPTLNFSALLPRQQCSNLLGVAGKPVTRVLHFLLLLVPKLWQAGRLGLLQGPGLCLTAWFWLRAGKGFGSLSERDLNPTVGLMVDAV